MERSLAGYSPWGHKERDTTEELTLSCLILPQTPLQSRLPHNIEHVLCHGSLSVIHFKYSDVYLAM